MPLLERLPLLDDAELTNLWNNAGRLIESGPERQRDSAIALMPAIEQELAMREAARKATIAKRAAERRARVARRAQPARLAEQAGAQA